MIGNKRIFLWGQNTEKGLKQTTNYPCSSVFTKPERKNKKNNPEKYLKQY